jgi:hypothetical protein
MANGRTVQAIGSDRWNRVRRSGKNLEFQLRTRTGCSAYPSQGRCHAIRSCPTGQRAQGVLRRRVDRLIPRHPNTGQSFCGSHPTAKYLYHQRHSDPHHHWAGPPRNQGATRRSRSKVSFGAPPSLISSRNFGSFPVPQVALRTLQPSGDSIYQNDAQL